MSSEGPPGSSGGWGQSRSERKYRYVRCRQQCVVVPPWMLAFSEMFVPFHSQTITGAPGVKVAARTLPLSEPLALEMKLVPNVALPFTLVLTTRRSCRSFAPGSTVAIATTYGLFFLVALFTWTGNAS